MIDWNRVRQLREEIGEDDFAEVLGLFFEEVEATVARLGVPAEATAREADLHSLKGSALNLGFAVLADLCQQGETLAAAGQTVETEVARVIAAYADSKQAFFQRQAVAA